MRNLDQGTIAAIATGSGGGIGIVRISGPDALSLSGRIFRARGKRPLEEAPPFLLLLGTVRDPDTGEQLDEVLATWMPQGRSYTGEPTVEIQGHGGRVVLEAVLQTVLRAGARLAEPGEFTKRAFLSGRLDLSQAEAVAELIGAESEAGLRSALHQLQGGVSALVAPLRERLLDLVARVETALDFEEDETPAEIPTAAEIGALADDIQALARHASAAATARGGVKVALAGSPNSGKSSIFNYLLQFERSIVSSSSGTTRDYIEERSALGGASVTLIDTAGMRATDDAVEAEGVRRSLWKIGDADLVVFVLDGSEPAQSEDRQLLALLADRSPLIVINKADLPQRIALGDHGTGVKDTPFVLSAATGEGFPGFTAALVSRCQEVSRGSAPVVATPGIRHRVALEKSARCLAAAARKAGAGDGLLDQVATDVRDALSAFDEITGETVTEDILERIFSTFCVGK